MMRKVDGKRDCHLKPDSALLPQMIQCPIS
jgi:hypothetical protein